MGKRQLKRLKVQQPARLWRQERQRYIIDRFISRCIFLQSGALAPASPAAVVTRKDERESWNDDCEKVFNLLEERGDVESDMCEMPKPESPPLAFGGLASRETDGPCGRPHGALD
eukprot:12206526-Karenia_brevis.AAC.1